MTNRRDRYLFRSAFFALLAAAWLSPAAAQAGERKFGYVYEATTAAQGSWEYEQYNTWKTIKDKDHGYDEVNFKHEFEYGVTDKLQLGFYISDWSYEDGKSVDDDGVKWNNAAIEAIYNLTHPTTDLIGSAVYFEYKMGAEVIELEGKLILQKNFGPFTVAYNAAIEAEWEGQRYREEQNGKFEQSFGVSYQWLPMFLTGVEAVHEIEWEDWHEQGDHVFYVGPNFSLRPGDGWFVTVTQLFQTTSVEDEASYQTRILFGIDF